MMLSAWQLYKISIQRGKKGRRIERTSRNDATCIGILDRYTELFPHEEERPLLPPNHQMAPRVSLASTRLSPSQWIARWAEPNPESYTSHALRRTAATIAAACPPGLENRRRLVQSSTALIDKSDVTKNTVAAFLQSAAVIMPSPLKTQQPQWQLPLL
jgi:integrase